MGSTSPAASVQRGRPGLKVPVEQRRVGERRRGRRGRLVGPRGDGVMPLQLLLLLLLGSTPPSSAASRSFLRSSSSAAAALPPSPRTTGGGGGAGNGPDDGPPKPPGHSSNSSAAALTAAAGIERGSGLLRRVRRPRSRSQRRQGRGVDALAADDAVRRARAAHPEPLERLAGRVPAVVHHAVLARGRVEVTEHAVEPAAVLRPEAADAVADQRVGRDRAGGGGGGRRGRSGGGGGGGCRLLLLLLLLLCRPASCSSLGCPAAAAGLAPAARGPPPRGADPGAARRSAAHGGGEGLPVGPDQPGGFHSLVDVVAQLRVPLVRDDELGAELGEHDLLLLLVVDVGFEFFFP